jgi:CopG family transcriptional regulator, nickel-responsive regulator
MASVVRQSFSIEAPLYADFKRLLRERGYANQSEFLRDLIRGEMVREEWKGNEEVLGTITIVYNHHTRELTRKLTKHQHEHLHTVLAATHVHIDHDHCAEAILVRGPAKQLQALADQLRQQKGVLHATLAMSTVSRRRH